MSQAAVMPRAKNKQLQPNLRWERRPRFVREYVWPGIEFEPQCLTTALSSETAPPLPGPPQNELSDIEK